MLQLVVWLVGLLVASGANTQNELGLGEFWWHGVLFATALFPIIWVFGILLPRLALNFASGAMIGGGIAVGIAIFNGTWAYIAGGLATVLVGLMTTFGQKRRVGD